MADPRLSRIETLWSVVRQAHADDSEETTAARARLIERYHNAIRRYLMACLRDPDGVDEVFQEFSLRFVRGDFSNVDANKGRFRSYIKTVIYHLAADFSRARQKHTIASLDQESLPADHRQGHHDDDQFLAGWRESLLASAWDELRREEESTGKAWHTVLQARSKNPGMRSADLARHVSALADREISTGNVRVLLHRARERFAAILIHRVRDSLAGGDQQTLEQELIDLNLWQYCRPLLRSTESER